MSRKRCYGLLHKIQDIEIRAYGQAIAGLLEGRWDVLRQRESIGVKTCKLSTVLLNFQDCCEDESNPSAYLEG